MFSKFEIWKKIEIKTMENCLHLKCQILLFKDIFERFSNGCLENDGLCPSHYLKAPAQSNSCNAMLYMTKVKLDPISVPWHVFTFWKRNER